MSHWSYCSSGEDAAEPSSESSPIDTAATFYVCAKRRKAKIDMKQLMKICNASTREWKETCQEIEEVCANELGPLRPPRRKPVSSDTRGEDSENPQDGENVLPDNNVNVGAVSLLHREADVTRRCVSR